MATIQLKTEETGYAELYFEYIVVIPEVEISQFEDDFFDNPIETLNQYSHQILNDYEEYILNMEIEDISGCYSTLYEDQEEFQNEKSIPFSDYLDHHKQIMHHLHESLEHDTDQKFANTMKSVKDTIMFFKQNF